MKGGLDSKGPISFFSLSALSSSSSSTTTMSAPPTAVLPPSEGVKPSRDQKCIYVSTSLPNQPVLVKLHNILISLPKSIHPYPSLPRRTHPHRISLHQHQPLPSPISLIPIPVPSPSPAHPPSPPRDIQTCLLASQHTIYPTALLPAFLVCESYLRGKAHPSFVLDFARGNCNTPSWF